MKATKKDGVLEVELVGHISINNASEFEETMMSALSAGDVCKIEIDASDLEYISSVGLRVIVKVTKKVGDITIFNVRREVYDVFDMTGLTQMIDIRREMHQISIDGLPMIGKGANGEVYRIDAERIVKVYNPLTNPPEKIAREKQVAREAFIHGVPSALSYEMVHVGDRIGIVYEMIDAMTLGEAIARQPERLEEYATRMAQMLRELHATEFAPGVLPDARLSLHAWVDVAERSGYYTDKAIVAARKLVDSIPPRNTFIHGDFHPGNIMVTDDDEFLLIDMGDASVGDPVIDLIASYQIMRLVAEQPGGAQRYTGLTSEQSLRVWDVFVRTYYGIDDPAEIEAIERRLKFYVIPRSMSGVTFSDVIPEKKRKAFAAIITKVLLEGMTDEIVR